MNIKVDVQYALSSYILSTTAELAIIDDSTAWLQEVCKLQIR